MCDFSCTEGFHVSPNKPNSVEPSCATDLLISRCLKFKMLAQVKRWEAGVGCA